jgi:hypothetical protein
MELIVGVPEGTAARLEAFNEMMLDCAPNSAEEERAYAELFSDEPLHRLSDFDSFGWGKLGAAEWAYIDALGKDRDSGSLKDGEAARLIELHGVKLPEGVTVKTVTWG